MKRVATLLLLLLLLAACTSTSPSGFLGDYSDLTPRNGVEGQRAWFKPGLDLRSYDRLMIDPIEVRLHEDGSARPEALRRTSEQFRRILIETIGPYYPVVTERGQHTLRVRIAITDIIPSGGEVRMNGAALEVELLDPDTSERLAAVVDRGGSVEVPEAAMREWAQRLLNFTDSYDR